MHDIFLMLSQNGLWVMIVAVVGIGAYFTHRKHELDTQSRMRAQEQHHQQKMKELEIELEKAK